MSAIQLISNKLVAFSLDNYDHVSILVGAELLNQMGWKDRNGSHAEMPSKAIQTLPLLKNFACNGYGILPADWDKPSEKRRIVIHYKKKGIDNCSTKFKVYLDWADNKLQIRAVD